jgi:lantibiotic modifying enzyme
MMEGAKMNINKFEKLAFRGLEGTYLALPKEKKCKFGEVIGNDGVTDFRIDLGSGIGGFIHVLSLAKRLGFSIDSYIEFSRTNIDEILRKSNKLLFDGIVYGKTGLSISICDAYYIGILDDFNFVKKIVLQVLNRKPDWPDFMYGAAGQGLAALYCSNIIDDLDLIDIAEKYADYLVKVQSPSGFWPLPKGVRGLDGNIYYGFAHGSAGILYFLLEYSKFRDERKILNALNKGLQSILRVSIANGNGQIYWPIGTSDESVRFWWCHGSPGISLLFLKLYETGYEKEMANTTKSILNGIPKKTLSPSPSMNLSICHGLSGLGEIYLTASRILNESVWYERALEIGKIIQLLAKDHRKSGISWYSEPQNPAIALWTGQLGIIHFLLRLSKRGLGNFPLLM